MSELPQVAGEIAALLSSFVQNPANADLIKRATAVDWAKSSLEERAALNDAFLRIPEIQSAKQKFEFFGYPSTGIGGILSGSVVVGAGGGGGGLWRNGEPGKGVGFAFGSLGMSLGGSGQFLIIGYRAKPADFWGLMHGAFAKVAVAPGVGVFWGHLGAGWQPEYELLMFAVGLGLEIGASGFVGGAWNG